MGELSLHGEWLATWADGLHGKWKHAQEPVDDVNRYMTMKFPGSIQTNLVAAGIIDDSRISINSLKARWVEEHFWILRKSFYVPPEAADQSPRLNIEILDGVAQVYLNGIFIGGHANSHYPASFDLSWVLRPGINELVILLESGLYRVADLPGHPYSQAEETVLNKRQYLRQPQYQFGWDWNPRLIFFGLHGDMRITWGDTPRLLQVSVLPELSPDLLSGRIILRPRWYVPGDGQVKIQQSITSRDELGAVNEYILNPGVVESEIILEINNPVLWWPKGHGSQELYPLELVVSVGDTPVARWVDQTGLRKVDIEQTPHPEGGNYFKILINNRAIFCKGSNWIPPEMSAFEVSDEKIRELVELASEQNFNILRIWGGGVWAGHSLLDRCDEEGILVWHDLLFACSKYPADKPAFLSDVENEIAWGLREFSPHPSLAVWCGNNEMEWGLWSLHYKEFGKTAPDYVLFHHIIPALINKIDPTRPYWPSSPYSSPAQEPNDPLTGDQHPWGVSIIHETEPENIWMYRGYVDRFPNEGGVLGVSLIDSLRKFLPGSELTPRSFAWEHHDNTINFWHSRQGVGYRLVEDWIGKSVESLSLDALTLASGLVQSEGLKEYIRNYRRRWPSSSSAIYWDYVDSWPSIHGWGTLDYYLKRKPSFYAVKRANKPVIVVLSDDDAEPAIMVSNNELTASEMLGVYVVNDTVEEVALTVETGHFTAQGLPQSIHEKHVIIPPFTSTRVENIRKDESLIAFAVIRNDEGLVLDWDRILFRKPYEWEFTRSEIQVSVAEGEQGRFAQLLSQNWVWGVILDPDGNGLYGDDIFDLFPGIPYQIPLGESEEPPIIKITGSDLILSLD